MVSNYFSRIQCLVYCQIIHFNRRYVHSGQSLLILELSKHFIKTIRAKDKLFVWGYKLFAENQHVVIKLHRHHQIKIIIGDQKKF